jgi:hypothetical protein
MENLIPKSLLSSIRKSFEEKQGVKKMDEAFMQFKGARYASEISIFLSHKHDEENQLKDAIALFNSVGASVYIDWEDEGMPSGTSGTTAMRIKEKIRENKKFVLLATDGAIASKWCNWELGHGDSVKFPTNLAIMPITQLADNKWSGSEYLQIYPIITSGYHYTFYADNIYVEFKGTKTKLAEWLKV